MLDQIHNSERILKQIFFPEFHWQAILRDLSKSKFECAYINSPMTLSLSTASENKIKNWIVLQFSMWASI